MYATIQDAFFSKLLHFVKVKFLFRAKTFYDFPGYLGNSLFFFSIQLIFDGFVGYKAVCLRFRNIFELSRGAAFEKGRMSDGLQRSDFLNLGLKNLDLKGEEGQQMQLVPGILMKSNTGVQSAAINIADEVQWRLMEAS